MVDAAQVVGRLEADLDEAEFKAWDSLARYKFQMFGYWAAIWVHLNRAGGFKRPNPFKPLVATARARGSVRALAPRKALPPACDAGGVA